jgi:beta-glucosidase
MIEFPGDFFWGAATSAYQVEGNNSNCDWWEWEKRVGLKETSGSTCLHYQFYKQDFDLAKALNHNTHRLSIEWSRIEPRQGSFSDKEIQHYIEVIRSLKERNLEPIVTLHHFTNPLWFAKLGGWQNRKSIAYFLRYVEKIAEALAEMVSFWVTINEPMVYIYQAYILGVWPPQEESFLKAGCVKENLLTAHIQAYREIHNIYKKQNLQKPQVSIAQNLVAFAPCSPTLKNRLAVILRNKLYNFGLIERLISLNSLDFIGINYYTRNLIDARGFNFRQFLLGACSEHNMLKKNSLGWEIYPEGLYKLLIDLKKYNLPVFILENGISTDDDNLRWEFIRQHLENTYQAIKEGVNILGYIYWSLLDNYEWEKGFAPRFGLIAVDYNTYKRTIRESAKRLSVLCQTGRL